MRIDPRESLPLGAVLSKRHPLGYMLETGEELFPPGTLCRDAPLPATPGPIAPGVAAALEESCREHDAPAAVAESVRLLAGGAPAVVTGQQPGLFGGPLLTLLKAVSAVWAARRLTEREGRPFVPIFWSAADDHDLEEVNQIWVPGPDAGPRRFALPGALGNRPVGTLPLGEAALGLANEVIEASGATEFSAPLREALREEIRLSPRLTDWFARSLYRLLGDEGLVVLDALDPRLKEPARHLWRRVLEEPLYLTRTCREAGRELAGRGLRPQLVKSERQCPFLLVLDGIRHPVTFERKMFRAAGKAFTPIELHRRLEEHPADFSPGVLLRPLLQDYLLPTALYVGGPAEIAYFVQLFPGYEWAGVSPPRLLPRCSLTFVEPHVQRILRRLDLTPQELRAGIGRPLRAAVRREHRLAATGRWERLRAASLRPLDRLRDELAGEDPDALRATETARGRIEFLLGDLEKRVTAALGRRSETTRRRLETARSGLFPSGHLQERLLGTCHFLNRYGPGLPAALLAGLPDDFTRHWFAHILA